VQSDETLGKLVYEIQILRGIAESIQQRMDLVNTAITELRLAASTLEGIGSEESGNSLLVPIGGSSYIRARLDDKERLIVGIGADVAVEKTVGEAKEDFQARVLELEKVRISLQQQLEETLTKIDGVQREIQRVTQQKSGEAGDVRGA